MWTSSSSSPGQAANDDSHKALSHLLSAELFWQYEQLPMLIIKYPSFSHKKARVKAGVV